MLTAVLPAGECRNQLLRFLSFIFIVSSSSNYQCFRYALHRPFSTLHRNIPVAISDDESKPWTVQESLRHHFSPEIRELKCEKCTCEKARHTAQITKKPLALLLCFKRFDLQQPINTSASQNNKAEPADKENQTSNGSDDSLPPLEGSDEKTKEAPASSSAPASAAAFVMPAIHRSKVRVLLQDKVCLDPFMVKEGDEKDEDPIVDDSTSKHQLFTATGVIHHIGSTPHSGHYTAHAVRSKDLGLFDDNSLGDNEKKWVTFDDTATSFTDPASVLDKDTSQRNTYMAMYVAE